MSPLAHTHQAWSRRAFSLVELVMVVSIISIIAAIAVPRVSHATGEAYGSAMKATLAGVRKAIDAYYAEHDRYPGYDPVTAGPDGIQFVDQLLMYSDRLGKTQPTYGSPYLYGPYLRAPFPENPFNGLRTVQVKTTPADPDPADGSVGWVAVLSHGYFGISVTDEDLDRVGVELSKRDLLREK